MTFQFIVARKKYQVNALNSWSQFCLLTVGACTFYNFHTNKPENEEDLNQKDRGIKFKY